MHMSAEGFNIKFIAYHFAHEPRNEGLLWFCSTLLCIYEMKMAFAFQACQRLFHLQHCLSRSQEKWKGKGIKTPGLPVEDVKVLLLIGEHTFTF